ncbi:putative repeat protein (TIGR02543 family) [Acholeplasma morum]|uniref:InlB B-repeat-containing protein n=1 Tax=Paracholeplasma morum TaxID=264637 RepID=UPI00195D056A|nr:InlB B-repeat-containing protein [Paracholeplasma morum]MBM7454128.1 putative repeat protein (TIGR02543 family) [Paracholeplasma morum]
MNKLWMAVLIVLFGVSLSACKDEKDYQSVLEKAANTLEVPEETLDSIELKDSLSFEGIKITITWRSDKTYITDKGVVIRPAFSLGDQTVKLTASLSYLTFKYDKVFDVLVLKKDSPTTVTVSFNTQGAAVIPSQNINEASKATLVDNPTKAGYVFKEWRINGIEGNVFSFDTLIYESMMLYAVYEEVVSKIHFDANGGTEISSITGKKGDSILLPSAPTKEGFEFDGWYLDIKLTEPFQLQEMPSGEITLYAKWNALGKTLSFNTNGGSDIESFSRPVNAVITGPEDPVKEGHKFLGWFKDEAFSVEFDFGVMPNEDLVLFAKWETKPEITLDYLDIFYVNDTHGSIERSGYDLGLAYISNYVNYYRAQNPNGTILLSGGDMFQGSALSNYYMGLSTLNIMNEMGFDAMTLGNHEFDWGIEVIQQYFDGAYDNYDANFPILAANAVKAGTTTPIEHIDPYTIIERGGVKIGVIGTIGSSLENSIAYSRINGYEFLDERSYIEYYTEELRTEEDVDYVILMMHDNGSIYNLDQLAKLTGSKKIDLMFNAHTHQRYVNEYSNGLLEVQSGSNGRYVGTVRIDLSTGSISAKNVNDHEALYEADPKVERLINAYKQETDELFNREIIRSSSYYSQDEIARWLAKVIVKQTGANIAFQNIGGTRADIRPNEALTLGKLFQIFPFDNVIKTVLMDGGMINNIKDEYLYSSDGTVFQSGKLYLVATNDYVFDKTDGFYNGTEPKFDGSLLRDIVENELLLQAMVYDKFNINNPILTTKKETILPKALYQQVYLQ